MNQIYFHQSKLIMTTIDTGQSQLTSERAHAWHLDDNLKWTEAGSQLIRGNKKCQSLSLSAIFYYGLKSAGVLAIDKLIMQQRYKVCTCL